MRTAMNCSAQPLRHRRIAKRRGFELLARQTTGSVEVDDYGPILGWLRASPRCSHWSSPPLEPGRGGERGEHEQAQGIHSQAGMGGSSMNAATGAACAGNHSDSPGRGRTKSVGEFDFATVDAAMARDVPNRFAR